MSWIGAALVALTLASVWSGVISQVFVQPEQVHLSYAVGPTQMTLTWVTQSEVNQSYVEYGINNLDNRAKGIVSKFVDGGPAKHTIWIHRVTLTSLKPAQKYLYHVGSVLGWSGIFSFKTMDVGSNWAPRFAVYGDMGNENAQAMGWLQEDVQRKNIDAILHIGDFAYDLHTNNSYVGDAFMNQIEAIAAYVPYMTCPGNHESKYGFSNYKYRFAMPSGSRDEMYYSFNIGASHIVSINTEVYYSKELNHSTIKTQYDWLLRDLEEANKPENRAERPWLIVVGHRPMYCSNSDGPVEHCNNPFNPVRIGLPLLGYPGLEDLFYRQGVDLQFYAHEHSYERLWPIYNFTVCNGTRSPYEDPRAPVHIVTGSAGNREGQTGWDHRVYPWSSFHTDDFGYTRMTIHNATHLYLEQVSTNKGGSVVDKMMLVKNRHGMGLYDCHKARSH